MAYFGQIFCFHLPDPNDYYTARLPPTNSHPDANVLWNLRLSPKLTYRFEWHLLTLRTGILTRHPSRLRSLQL
jgi:hypothetical protein